MLAHEAGEAGVDTLAALALELEPVARLIAAAPELLAVCEEIAEHETDDWEARMVTLRAAIAKAKGEA